MNSAALSKLQRLLDADRVAEATRFCAVRAQAAVCRRRAAHLRGQIGAVGSGDVAHTAPDAGSLSTPGPAANLWAVSRWSRRLAQQAGDEDAQAAVLEAEAELIRPRLARAFGRYTVVGAMAEKARAEERHLAQYRTEAAIITPQRTPDQPVWSGSASAVTSAGSPGKK